MVVPWQADKFLKDSQVMDLLSQRCQIGSQVTFHSLLILISQAVLLMCAFLD